MLPKGYGNHLQEGFPHRETPDQQGGQQAGQGAEENGRILLPAPGQGLIEPQQGRNLG